VATSSTNTAVSFEATNGAWILSGTSAVTGTNATTTSWTIGDGTTVLSGTMQVASGQTTTTIDYDSPYFTGLTQTIFTSDGRTLTGSVNGRAIVPENIANPSAPMTFADRAPPPVATVEAGVQSKIYALLDQATAAVPTVCPGVDAGAGTPTAVSSLVTAFWHAPAAITGPVSTPELRELAQEAKIGLGAAPKPTLPGRLHAEGTVSTTIAGTSSDEYASYQNNALDFNTPECQSCEEGCGTNPLIVFAPPALAICMGYCFAPGQGCGEVICPVAGIASCDKGETCCGTGSSVTNGGCCPSGDVCGDYNAGTCCPAANPVACGGSCFPKGSVCCDSRFPDACASGQACVNTGTTASEQWGCCPAGQVNVGAPFSTQQCCAPDEVDSAGACCTTPLCGGVCCTGGQCANGSCCYGAVAPDGTCCPLDDTVVNGSCCPSSQACGSACCPSGESCLNAATSECGTPANTCTGGLVVCTNGSSSFCCYADQNCNASVPGCCGGSEPGAEPCNIK
jgi:hypothetical protein